MTTVRVVHVIKSDKVCPHGRPHRDACIDCWGSRSREELKHTGHAGLISFIEALEAQREVLMREHKAMLENLTAVQARCTELKEENRKLWRTVLLPVENQRCIVMSSTLQTRCVRTLDHEGDHEFLVVEPRQLKA